MYTFKALQNGKGRAKAAIGGGFAKALQNI